MGNKSPCKDSIDQLRNELHQLIESEQLNSDAVQERSEELDALILLYYRQEKECQELKEP
jgi:hypothetical protein